MSEQSHQPLPHHPVEQVVRYMVAENMYQVIVNSLSTHVAVLDKNGIIVETNYAWQQFAAENGFEGRIDCVGLNYLAICDRAPKDDSNSHIIGKAIRKVITGEVQEFMTQYPCHSPTQKRWYSLRVVPYRDEKVQRAIVTHENITPIMLAQEKIQAKEKELEESNIAMKVLLDHREKDLLALEERIVANIHELVMPSLDKLLESRIPDREKNLVDIAQSHLKDVVSPFLTRLSNMNLLLTPQEIEVATLVRQGKSSQEIADILTVSVATISFHRKKLRQKLGISKKGTNLRTYLLSLR